MKICILGCGLRTPLLLHGLIHSGLDIQDVTLYDTDNSHSQLMSQIGRHMAASTSVNIQPTFESTQAIEGSSFVISSIRVGGMEARAHDERLSLECGFAGQETTGPAGFAMALRTIPVALAYARTVEKVAPSAWIVNFTNPAGIITQAISTYTRARVLGICDTPAELILQIARALGEALSDVRCDYLGLNHLGWVKSVRLRGEEVICQLLDDDRLLERLYPSALFSPPFLKALRLLPTEYLFFYYNQALARDNQRKAGATRGAELERLNQQVWTDLEKYVRAGTPDIALEVYRRYLNRRNWSYMKLEGAAESAFHTPEVTWDPFEGETGYHRIAVEVIRALTSAQPHSLILNVPNNGAIEGLEASDVVEVPCMVDHSGARPLAAGALPESVRGLGLAVKQFERLTVQAAVEERWGLATFALAMNPIVANWSSAAQFVRGLSETDPRHFSHFKQ